jgi:hypothetical protein
MRLAYLLSQTDNHSLNVPEVTAVLTVPYKTAVRMLDRVCDALITYKGLLSEKRFGKPVTYYITAKARPPQPRLRYPKHPANLSDKANVGRRYAKWKERLKLDAAVTPEPIGILASLNSATSPPENLDRVERLLMIVLNADPKEVSAARKLRCGWELHRSRLHAARVRLPSRLATKRV